MCHLAIKYDNSFFWQISYFSQYFKSPFSFLAFHSYFSKIFKMPHILTGIAACRLFSHYQSAQPVFPNDISLSRSTHISASSSKFNNFHDTTHISANISSCGKISLQHSRSICHLLSLAELISLPSSTYIIANYLICYLLFQQHSYYSQYLKCC